MTTETTQANAGTPVRVAPIVRPLADPCYDGKTHLWRTLYEPPCNLPVRWCQKCGKRVKPNTPGLLRQAHQGDSK